MENQFRYWICLSEQVKNLIGNVALVNTSGLPLVITGLVKKEVALLVVEKEVGTPADLHLMTLREEPKLPVERVFWILVKQFM